jgi:hypothetical protein
MISAIYLGDHMKIKSALLGAAFACSMLAGAAAQAALITSAEGNYYAFPVVNYFGPGPQTFGPGITWSSTNASTQGGSVFGYNSGYNFGGNGFSSGVSLVGLNDSTDAYGITDSMTFTFASPVSVVGAILNWFPSNAPVTIEALSSTNVVLDSYTLGVGGGNNGAPNTFFGFKHTTKDISSFVLTDGYVAAIGGINAGVPETSTWVMLLAGFAGLGFLGYRRGKAAASVAA